ACYLFNLIILATVSCVLVLPGAVAGQNTTNARSGSIDGVYEFVSERSSLTKPEIEDAVTAYPKWRGIWIFTSRYFSITLMEARRGNFFEEDGELGYASFAGKFSIKGNEINLVQS